MEYSNSSEHFKEIKQYLKEQQALKMSGLFSELNSNEEFLKTTDLIKKYKIVISTILKLSASENTVYNDGSTQTRGGVKNRSLGDLYRITISLFPKVTLRAFITSLSQLIEEEKVATIICCTIHKRVYFLNGASLGKRPSINKMFSGTPVDEFYIDWTKVMREKFPFNWIGCKHNKDIGGFWADQTDASIEFYDGGEPKELMSTAEQREWEDKDERV